MKKLGLRAAARELGLSHVGLLKAANEGRVTRGKDGKFDVEKCREQLNRNTNPKKQTTQEKPTGDYNAAVTKREWLKVEKDEIDLARRRAELVSVVQINAYIAGMIIRSREVLLRIAPELRDSLAQETDPVKCEAMVAKEVDRALRELAIYEHRQD